MTDGQMLNELDAILGSRPRWDQFGAANDGAEQWLGRAKAVLRMSLDSMRVTELEFQAKAVNNPRTGYGGTSAVAGLNWIVSTLHEVRHNYLLKSGGSGAVAMDQGKYFEYFDAVKNLITTATKELFFIDPYLDDTFVSTYLIFAPAGVKVRLLGGQECIGRLKPAAESLRKQRGDIEVRLCRGHDRYLIIDGTSCHMSGASFKDGPKNSFTVLTEFVDAASALISLNEKKWEEAERVIPA